MYLYFHFYFKKDLDQFNL